MTGALRTLVLRLRLIRGCLGIWWRSGWPAMVAFLAFRERLRQRVQMNVRAHHRKLERAKD